MRLSEYDLIIINTSGGKDSQTILDVVCKQAKEQGALGRVIAAHAELEEEWAGTKELVQEQVNWYGVPVFYMKRPQGSLLEQIEKRGKWPSNKIRFCTSDHKRGQLDKVLTSVSNGLEKPHVKVLNVMGIRAAESSARAKKKPFEMDQRRSNKKRTVWNWFPIFDWSEKRVWENIHSSGVPYHQAYKLGMPRLSCCFCVFASYDALLLAGHHNKALLERYATVERKIGHTFRKELPIVNVQAAVLAGQQPGKISTWEM